MNEQKLINVKNPEYYSWRGKECREFVEEFLKNSKGCSAAYEYAVLKYLYRYPKKGKAIEDLRKAKRYIEFLIEKVEEDEAQKSS